MTYFLVAPIPATNIIFDRKATISFIYTTASNGSIVTSIYSSFAIADETFSVHVLTIEMPRNAHNQGKSST